MIECLLSKYEDLSSIPRIKDARNGGTCLQSQGFGGRNGRIPWACWLSSLTKSISFRFNKRPCVKKKVGGQLKKTLVLPYGLNMQVHICGMHIHPHAHTGTHAHKCTHMQN